MEKMKTLVELPIVVSDDVPARFSAAMAVFLGKSHVINRRIVGTTEIVRFDRKRPYSHEEAHEVLRTLASFDATAFGFLVDLEQSGLLTDSLAVIFRKFIPRCEKISGLAGEVVVIESGKYTFIPWLLRSPCDPSNHWVAPTLRHEFSLHDEKLVLKADEPLDEKQEKMQTWLAEKVVPKILNWINSDLRDSCGIEPAQPTSLRLIDLVKYGETYQRLKDAYAGHLRKIWIGDKPDKDIHEEIGIAAYLISLWMTLEPTGYRPSFVDLGCGNGLLPYILNKEGYQGRGLDLRDRALWKMFEGSEKYLEVAKVEPYSVFPGVDWVIGNHSDELTPWVPVIAHRSGPKTKFFLLPCCPYDHFGKFGRNGHTSSSKTSGKQGGASDSNSTYGSYKKFLEKASEDSGFKVLFDKLRIPSTKRECLIGIPIDCPEEAMKKIDENISELLQSPKLINVFNDVKENAMVVRNCTRCDRDIVASVVRKVFGLLLSSSEPVIHANPVEGWELGGSLAFPEIVSCLTDEEMREMKAQCGGVQTLLKNHGYIFKVVRGRVELKPPSVRKTPCPPGKFKTKPCFFHTNHPNGCPLDESDCSFNHV